MLTRDIELEIVEYLNKGKKVFIESGAANDTILSYRVVEYKKYSWQDYTNKDYYFETTNCIFPKEVQLTDFSFCTSEEYEGNLFVKVS